jgi:hypothetical protein
MWYTYIPYALIAVGGLGLLFIIVASMCGVRIGLLLRSLAMDELGDDGMIVKR